MSVPTIHNLLALTARLKTAHIYSSLSTHTEGAIMVEVCVPGERWEIEFHEDGTIGVEIFVTKGGIQGAEALENLFDRFSD